jgi:hypothetical protein
MILCPKPYYNEPGRVEPSGRDGASENFNNYVKVQCVRYAMLDWLTDPDKRSGIWKESLLSLHNNMGCYTLTDIVGCHQGAFHHQWS